MKIPEAMTQQRLLEGKTKQTPESRAEGRRLNLSK